MEITHQSGNKELASHPLAPNTDDVWVNMEDGFVYRCSTRRVGVWRPTVVKRAIAKGNRKLISEAKKKKARMNKIALALQMVDIFSESDSDC